MEAITKAEFLAGYEKGYITDIVAIGSKVYGKDPRGQAGSNTKYKIVWSNI